MKGIVNGDLDILQKDGVYPPKSDISIKKLNVNRFDLGDLTAKVIGNNSFNRLCCRRFLNKKYC